MKKAKTVGEFIRGEREEVRPKLRQLQKIVKTLAPGAEEKLSYGMPYYSLNGRLLYFNAFKNHIGLFAMPSAVRAFKKELKGYKTSTGTIQFSLDKPLPVALIRKIVRYRVKEQRAKAKKLV
jgi:uncharacterized protein YdhG (YjbR/CyaY superfamily)